MISILWHHATRAHQIPLCCADLILVVGAPSPQKPSFTTLLAIRKRLLACPINIC